MKKNNKNGEEEIGLTLDFRWIFLKSIVFSVGRGSNISFGIDFIEET